MIATKALASVTWVVSEEPALSLPSDSKVHVLSTIFHLLFLMLSLENNEEQILLHVSARAHLFNKF